MVYKENFVVAIKCEGKILRESGGYVTLPFTSDYSLLLKNLDTRRAVVKVSIDGSDVLNAHRIVIGPNSETTLEGFIEGSEVKNKFRFIQKTEEIVEHCGDKVDDGIIRVEVQWEDPIITHRYYSYQYPYQYETWYYSYQYPYQYEKWPDPKKGWYEREYLCSNLNMSYCCTSDNSNKNEYFVNYLSTPKEDEGITVKGKDTRQHFDYTSLGKLDEKSTVIILRLKGTNSKNEKVETPVLVKDKIECTTCGHKFKLGAKFCSNCGTRL